MAVAATDPREIEQALRKGGIEIRKLEAEASKAEADLIPALPATIPAGKLTTGDDASPLGVVAAYRSLAAAANMVVADLPADAVGVWVTGPGTAEACRAAHDVIETALSRLEAAVDSALSQLPEGPRRGGTRLVAPAALALAFTGLAAVIGPIASLLSTDRTIRSTDVSLGLNAIAAAVARAALEARSDRPVRVGSLPQADSALAGRLVALREKVESLGSRVAAFRANPRRDLIAQSAAATEQLAAVRLLAGEAAKNTQWAKFSQVVYQAGKHGAADGRNRAKLAEIERVATMADETVASATGALALLVTPDGSGTSPLQRAEAYAASKTACIVILEPGCAAAESVYEDIKVKRDRGMHTGSTTFSYLILDDGGAVRAAGIAHGHVAALSKVGVPHVAWSDEEPTDDPMRRLLTGNGSS